MKLPKVLYFSLNPFSVEQFYLYNKKNRACELLSFRLYPEADGKNDSKILYKATVKFTIAEDDWIVPAQQP